MLTVDIHTHIMPPKMPDFQAQFGYGGFISLDHHKPCCARMMRDDGHFFREVEDNCWSPTARLKDCHTHEIDVQVLSTIPVLFAYWAKPQDGLTVARYLNDHIAQTVAAHPQNFVGLGTLPMQDPTLAIGELERCMSELGLAGVEIGSHVGERNLDDPGIFAVFEAAADLGAAVFIHPWDMMGQAEMSKYWLPWLVGMPAETSRAICSLIFGGVLERLPHLRIAFAHGGGSFPATIGRIAHGFDVRPDLCAIDNTLNPRDYLGRFYCDSLVHDSTMLAYLISLIGADHVALGSDYPFPLGELQPGKLIRSMPNLSNDQRNSLCHGSALTWLNLEKEQFLKDN